MLSYLIAFHPPQGHYSAFSKVRQATKKDPLEESYKESYCMLLCHHLSGRLNDSTYASTFSAGSRSNTLSH